MSMDLLYKFVINFFPVVALFVCAYAALRLFKNYKKNDNKIVGYFSGFFVFKFLAFGLIIMAIIIVLSSGNSVLADTLMALGISSMDFGLIFIGLVLASLFNYKYRKIFYGLLIIIAVAFLVINLKYIPSISSIPEIRMGVNMRLPALSAWYLFISHLPIMGLLGFIFLSKIPSLSRTRLKIRSFLIGLGLLSSTFGGPMFCFVETRGMQALMMALTLLGYILMFAGVRLYKEKFVIEEGIK